MAKSEFNPLKVVLQSHRVTYVHLKEPNAFEDSDPKYDATFLIPVNHPDVQKIKAAIKAAYDANKESVFGGTPFTSPKLWNPLRDGETWLEEHPEATEYEGMYFIKASSKSQPKAFDADKNDLFDLDEVYSGSYCRGVIQCYAFNKAGNKGFGFFLNSVMKIEDGERLGGYAASADDYDEDDYTPPPAARPKPTAAAPKSKRIFDVDANGDEIYSDDGENWFFVQ